MVVDDNVANALRGQVVLTLLALLIIYLHHESRQSVMRSDFGVAYCLRQWMSLMVAAFSVLAARMLYRLAQEGLLLSRVVATVLLPAMIIGFTRPYEPLRMKDLEALKKNFIKERWFPGHQPKTVIHAFQRMTWRGLRLQIQRTLLTLMRIAPDSVMMWNVDDSSNNPVLWFWSNDDAAYDQLAGMLRKRSWKMVCVCETARQQFYFILRGVPPSIGVASGSIDTVPAKSMLWYCQWLEFLRPDDAASRCHKYYDEMMALKLQMTTTHQALSNTSSDSNSAMQQGNDENQISVKTSMRELASKKQHDSAKESNDCLKAFYQQHQKVETSTFSACDKQKAEKNNWEWVTREPTDTAVILEWLYRRLFARVRWSKTFTTDIHNTLDECSKKCAYRRKLVQLSKVRNSEELLKECKSLETVYICYALQNIADGVEDLVAARDEFLERCNHRVVEIASHEGSEGMLAALQSLGADVVANVAMLTFLLVHTTGPKHWCATDSNVLDV